ncbi:MAG: hypothetical protein Q9191_007061 [Dirinaria sp. TL-2023a]
MEGTKLKAAILIISDTAFNDPSTDKSEDTLIETFSSERGSQPEWAIEWTIIIPDNVAAIRQHVSMLCDDDDDYMNLIVTTGGTGFTSKDFTPEAIKPMLDREAPGLMLRHEESKLIELAVAMMSRPVAGVRQRTLILTLPGSPKGAKENLASVLKLLPHACMQAAGGDSRTLHAGGVKKLEHEAGVSVRTSKAQNSQIFQHHHGHSHAHGGHLVPKAHTKPEDRPIPNDPTAGPSARHRKSPYAMLSVEDALQLISENTPSPKQVKAPVDPALVGRVLAEDVLAKEAVPAFRASIVDGYAIAVSEDGVSSKGSFPVASVSHAAPGEIPPLEPGTIARITTGAPLPPGATSCVMVEDTKLSSMTEDGHEEEIVEILTDEVKANENVREVGSDIRYGDVILKKGDEITAVGGELGLLASVGKAEVMVYEKPVVGVMSTGDEIIPHDRPSELRLGEVRDCNRPTVMAAVRGWGFQVVDLGVAEDTPGALEQSIRDAMRKVSVIITTGGVSMGELDLLKPTIERSLGGTIHFGRVSMKPGKPTTFATVPFKNNAGDPETRLIFSLPGNPASAVVTSHLFVLPSLHQACGVRPPGLPKVTVTLAHDIRLDKQRPEYHRASVYTASNGALEAASTGGQRSSRVGSLKGANALLCLPAREGSLKKGNKVEALVMGRLLGGGTN